MRIAEQLRQAFVNIRASKLRSFLALLGIMVGTAAVVALLSCGKMATEKALAEFRDLGTDLLAVTVMDKGKQPQSRSAEQSIPIQFWRQLPEYLPQIRRIAPYNSTWQPVSFAGKQLQAPIIAAEDSLADIVHIETESGRFLSFADGMEPFVVLGAAVASQLKAVTQDPLIGQQLRIGSSLFTIIGVAKPWTENAFFNEDVNQAVLIPAGAMGLFQQENSVNNAVLWLQQDIDIDAFLSTIKDLLQRQFPEKNVFQRSAKQIVASMESQGQIFTLLLGVIGGISLLVGGIGVMNIMLAAVSERKKEIGIRKAVGARREEIVQLFLVESVLIAVFGGFLGILMGLFFSILIAKLSGWPLLFTGFPLIIGFIVSVATGIFFGYYPAKRAAALPAIISLRGD